MRDSNSNSSRGEVAFQRVGRSCRLSLAASLGDKKRKTRNSPGLLQAARKNFCTVRALTQIVLRRRCRSRFPKLVSSIRAMVTSSKRTSVHRPRLSPAWRLQSHAPQPSHRRVAYGEVTTHTMIRSRDMHSDDMREVSATANTRPIVLSQLRLWVGLCPCLKRQTSLLRNAPLAFPALAAEDFGARCAGLCLCCRYDDLLFHLAPNPS